MKRLSARRVGNNGTKSAAKDLSRLGGSEFGEVSFLEGDQSARELEEREVVLVLL
jgi:hypothetical protein